ncbi:hypothetical protein SAMN04489717_3362 [Actinopolymorpha singaporensis]|uniref:Uncharacterized protein n=1 Tax=Actinopolymorpha singaporensis TaxID=117157 RepID=A0A1H1TVN5_9ACTN|nr:hypothetical protein SAMN04489717_3362 [Actinopolymorpha singaporensis]
MSDLDVSHVFAAAPDRVATDRVAADRREPDRMLGGVCKACSVARRVSARISVSHPRRRGLQNGH